VVVVGSNVAGVVGERPVKDLTVAPSSSPEEGVGVPNQAHQQDREEEGGSTHTRLLFFGLCPADWFNKLWVP
jgi:hypothetical protein